MLQGEAENGVQVVLVFHRCVVFIPSEIGTEAMGTLTQRQGGNKKEILQETFQSHLNTGETVREKSVYGLAAYPINQTKSRTKLLPEQIYCCRSWLGISLIPRKKEEENP